MSLLRNFKRFFNKALKQPAYAAGVLGKRLEAQISYRFPLLNSPGPEAITLFLTHKCNLQCKMCGQWGEGGVTKKSGSQYAGSELPFDNIKKLVGEVSASRPNITLFGGEPLLHAHFVEIVRYVKSKGMHCLVITNGSMLEKMAEDLVAIGLDELNVSLDGRASLHDEIRGMKGLFERIMSGLKKVKASKSSRGKSKPLVNLQCTVTKHNYRNLEDMIGVAREAGASSLTFHNLIFTNKKLLEEQKPYDELLGSSSEDWKGFDFAPEIDPSLLYGKMRQILAGKYPFSVDFYPNFSAEGLRRYYSDPSLAPGGANSEMPSRCLSPWIAAYVFPDGEVRPCLNSTYSFGNIKSSKFGDIWNGEKAVAFRRELKKTGTFPLCRRCTELYRY